MSINITHAGSRFILRIDNEYVAAYDSMDQLDVAVDAYRGIVR